MSNYREILDSADAIARKAAATLMSMRDQRLDVTRKEGLDIVTAADLASERIVIDGLRALTPQASILSEEAGTTGTPGESRWIVDPLDGTINYASGLPWFSVTMAYQERGETKVGLTVAPAAVFSAPTFCAKPAMSTIAPSATRRLEVRPRMVAAGSACPCRVLGAPRRSVPELT